MINTLGFIGHPIDMQTMYKMTGPFEPLARALPPFRLKELLKKIPPYRLNTARNIRSSKGVLVDCHTIICPLLPQDMVGMEEEFVIGRITEAVRRAERLGARIVALGGFASIIGNEGETVSRRVDTAITSGNTYAAALAIEGIIKAAYYMDVALPDATVAVIGATGDIGSICTRILSKKARRLNLVARNDARLTAFAEEIGKEGAAKVAVFKAAKDALREADVILAVTSAISAIIEPENLKPGCVVCDVAIPPNIAKEVVRLRDDIFVFEGGLATLPYQDEIRDRIFNELMPAGSIYGCLAEGIALAFEGRFDNYSVGRGGITEEKVDEISRIARKHGLRLAEFFCGWHFYSEEDIEMIKRNAKRNILSGQFAKR